MTRPSLLSSIGVPVLLGAITIAPRAQAEPPRLYSLAALSQTEPGSGTPGAPGTAPSAPAPSAPSAEFAPTTSPEADAPAPDAAPSQAPASQTPAAESAPLDPAADPYGEGTPAPASPGYRDATTQKQVANVQPPSDENLRSDAEEESDEEKDDKPTKRRFSSLLLLEGVAKYGGFSRGEDLGNPDLDRTTYRAGHFGGQVTLGIMPGGRYFTMAARLRGGAYLGGPDNLGTMGAAMLFGANFLRDETGKNFSYALGGFGVEFLPAINEDMLTAHVCGGAIVGGLDFSAGVDVGANDQFGMFIFGLQLGWGRLF